jgi:hypothetical protein
VCRLWAAQALKSELWQPLAVARWHLPPRRRSWENDDQALSRTWLRSYAEWHRAGRMPGGRFSSAVGTRVIAAACGARGSTHSSLPSPQAAAADAAAVAEEGEAGCQGCDDGESHGHHHHGHALAPPPLHTHHGAHAQPPSDGTGYRGVWGWAAVMGSDDVRLRQGRLVRPLPLACVTAAAPAAAAAGGGPAAPAGSTAPAAGTTTSRDHHHHNHHGHDHGGGDDGDSALCGDSCRVAHEVARSLQPFTDKIVAWQERQTRAQEAGAAAAPAAAAAAATAGGQTAARRRAPLLVAAADESAPQPLVCALLTPTVAGQQPTVDWRRWRAGSASLPPSATPAALLSIDAPLPLEFAGGHGGGSGTRLHLAPALAADARRLQAAPPAAAAGAGDTAATPVAAAAAAIITPPVPFLTLKVCLQNVHFGRLRRAPVLAAPVAAAVAAAVEAAGCANCDDGPMFAAAGDGGDDDEDDGAVGGDGGVARLDDVLVVAADAHLLLRDGTVVPAFLPVEHGGGGGDGYHGHYDSDHAVPGASAGDDGAANAQWVRTMAASHQPAVLAVNGESLLPPAPGEGGGGEAAPMPLPGAAAAATAHYQHHHIHHYPAASAVVLRPMAHAVLRLAFPFLSAQQQRQHAGVAAAAAAGNLGDDPHHPAAAAAAGAGVGGQPAAAAAAAAAVAAGVPLLAAPPPRFEPEALEQVDRLRLPLRSPAHPHAITHVLSLAFPDDGALWRGYRFVNAHMVLRVEPEAAT